jgi:Peptidase family M28/PDZ domain/PA domain
MTNRRYSAIVLTAALAALSTFYLGTFVAVPVQRPAADLVTGLSATRYLDHVKYLAGDEMKGRGDGSPELDKAADYIASQFRLWGLQPAGDNDSFFQKFEITTGANIGAKNEFALNGTPLRLNEDFAPVMFSSSGDIEAPLVFAGYGTTAPDVQYDDYQGIDATGKIVVAIRQPFGGARSAHEVSFISKAINAKQHGAKGIIFINDAERADQQVGRGAQTDETDDIGIPAILARRDRLVTIFTAAGKDIDALQKKIDSDRKPQSFEIPSASARIATEIDRPRKTVRNVVAYIPGSDPALQNEWVVVGAHYDHLGLGDKNSLAPSLIGQIHHGADDNASGTAGVLEIARLAAKNPHEWKRSVLFITFAGEELGLFGSSYFVNHPTIPLKNIDAMINMDMIGRLNNDRLFVGGVGTSPSFKSSLEDINKNVHLQLDYSNSGYGASDHMSFNAKKIPVLFIFSGLHSDYHKPSDTYDKINTAGAIKVLSLVYMMADRVAADDKHLEYVEVKEPEQAASGSGGGYGPYFGSVPDFRDDLKGVLFADVQNNSPAGKAGLKQGDLLVRFDGKPIENLYDFTFALRAKKPGDVVPVVVQRGGQEVKVNVTLEARK